MSSCRPSTQRPLPASQATRRGRLDVAAPTRFQHNPAATLKAGGTSVVTTAVAIVKIIPDEVGAP
jgi:hypothetical protein